MNLAELFAKTNFSDVQRWAVLAGRGDRTEAEENELRGLILTLETLGHALSPPCRSTAEPAVARSPEVGRR